MFKGLKNWAANTGKAFKLVGAELLTLPEKYKNLSPLGKAGVWAYGGLLAASCVGSFFIPALPGAIAGGGLALLGAQAIGVGAYTTMLVAQNMKNKQDIMNVLPVATGALGIQKALIGGYAYAAMAGIASVRAMALNAIGDRPMLRTATTLGLWAAGTAIMTFVVPWHPINLLPMASMTLATGADLIPSDSTRYARLARGIAFVNNTLYSALFTKSMPNTLLDLTVGATIANSIKRYDVPQSPEGQKVPLWDRLKLYAQNMLACKYMPAFYPAPKIEQPPEQGFKTEEESVVYWNWATRRSLGMAAAAKPPAAQDAPPIHANFDRSTSRAADASDVAADTGMCMPQRRIAIRYDIAA